ncbi:MAG: hypothetical protein AB1546_15240 [bacterium]
MNEKEQKLLKQLKDYFAVAREKVEPVHEEIRYNREIYLNKKIKTYWGEPNDDEKRQVFRSSLVASKIDTATAIQTDTRAKIFISPESPPAEEFSAEITPPPELIPHSALRTPHSNNIDTLAQTINKVFDNWWEENRTDEENYKIVKEARTAGTAVAKIRWDADAKNGQGEVAFERIPVEDFYPDPDADDIENCRYCFQTKIITMQELKERYGEKAKDIEPDAEYSILHNDRKTDDVDDGLKYRIEKVRLTECYFKSAAELEDRSDHPSPPNPQSAFRTPHSAIRTPHPQNGRLIVFAGSRILRDEPNPYPWFPFVKFTANPIPGSFWGKPDVRDLAPVQEIADMVMQQILANMKIVGNAKVIYEEGSLVDPDALSNLVGEMVRVTNLGGVRFIPAQPAAADGYAIYDRMLILADEISGIHDVSEGRRPVNVISGKAVINLQEGTNRKFRPSARFFEGFLKKAAEKILYLMLQHYKKGRIYRFGNERRLTGRLPIDLKDLNITFDITVGSNTSLPADKESRANLAVTLLQTRAEDGLPVVDRRYVLEQLELPGHEEVLKRLEAGNMPAGNIPGGAEPPADVGAGLALPKMPGGELAEMMPGNFEF